MRLDCFLSRWKQEYNELYSRNKEQSIEASITIFKILLCVAGFCCAFLVVVSFFVEGYDILRYCYLMFGIWLLGFACLINKSHFVQKNRFVFYLHNLISLVFIIYLSAFLTPDYIGINILVALIFIPMVVPDSYRYIVFINLFMASLYLGVVVPHKIPDLVADEIINVIDFALIGVVMGILIQRLRLKNLELSRCLNIERSTDVLTGLPNRRMLFEYFDYYKKCHNEVIDAIAMIDVDKFKEFNDTYGHVAGDQCLKAISEQLRVFGKAHDIEFYRYGGEEFVGIVHSPLKKKVAESFEEINSAVESLHIPHKSCPGGYVTVSIGICKIDPTIGDIHFEKEVSHADDALYKAKHLGRNQTVVYTEG